MKIPDLWVILSIHLTNKHQNKQRTIQYECKWHIYNRQWSYAHHWHSEQFHSPYVCSPYIGSASTVFSTAPIRPVGICQSTEEDSLSHLEILSLNFISQTHTADVCTSVTNRWSHPYEYQDKGWTRLFHGQSYRYDSWVVNSTCATSSELLNSYITVCRTIKVVSKWCSVCFSLQFYRIWFN